MLRLTAIAATLLVRSPLPARDGTDCDAAD
jgi:hypothetical protein